MSEKTIFQKIDEGEISTEFVHRDDLCFAIKDINPQATTHLLIIPKKPIPSIIDMEEGDEKLVGHLIKVAKEIAQKHQLKGYKLKINVGKDGGQEIFHLHVHLLSKFSMK